MDNAVKLLIAGGIIYLLTRKKSGGSLSGTRRKRRRRLSNLPYSKYHHKTEMPGVPGHHRLSDLGRIDNCYTYLTRSGKIWGTVDACFKGQSTYGEGKATFRAFDRDGYYIPGMTSERTMSFDDFDRLMEKTKARRIS